MSFLRQLPITLNADQEHNRLRLVVLLLLPPAIGLGFLLTNWLIHFLGGVLAEYVTFLSCLTGLVLGLGSVYLIEHWLVQVWPSGDQIVLAIDKVMACTREGEKYELDPAKEVVVTNWYFRLEGYPRVGNERRAGKGWFCLASQLQQNDLRLVVYTFLPPQETAGYTTGTEATRHPFNLIKPGLLYDRKQGTARLAPRPQIPPELLRSKDGRFWLAERYRWEEGLELTPGDFKLYLAYVNGVLPLDERKIETSE